MSIVEARKVVAAGADFLDEHVGEDEWPHMIDFATLDMRSAYACVAGQTLGWFTMEDLTTTYDEDGYDCGPMAWELGFDDRPGWFTYEDLWHAWFDLITERREVC